MICEWILRAWADLSSETIIAGFRGAQFTLHEMEIDSEVVIALEDLHQASGAVDSDDDFDGDDLE